ncbi:hypothetical protein [Paraburkholderia phytofirmans]|uniref:Uncharacterized protein n=1 Tax=Paraburkholderia phytofirmans TaxID=261302 RepID=A0ABW9BD21_9BURK
MASLLALYYVRKVAESEVWQGKLSGKLKSTAASRLVTGDSHRNLVQVLLTMTGFWLTQNVLGLFVPSGVLLKTLHLTPFQMTVAVDANPD